MPELVACPSCGCQIQMVEMFLGQRTRCIACSQVFTAAPLGPPSSHDVRKPPLPETAGLPRYRTPLCPQCHRSVAWEALHCPHCGLLLDPAEETDRGDWALRRDAAPHRAGLIDTLGSISMLAGVLSLCLGVGLVVAVGLGIAVLVMAGHDLEQMRIGAVDPQGRAMTEFGRTKAIAGIVIGLLYGLVFFLVVFGT